MARSISRRSFLLGAAATVGVAACGTSKAKTQLNLLMTTDPSQLLAGIDERLAFVLHGQTDFVTPDSPVTLAFGPGLSPDHLGPPVTGVIHTDSAPAPAYVTTTYRFPAPGDYYVRATYKGKTADAPLQGVISPSAATVPIPGKPLISIATPTTANDQGVKPICTRNPPCPWHDVSLDVALTQHRPIALLFATPALCQTATCGPVLEQLLTLKSQFEAKIRFLHSEIYTDSTAKTNTPAVVAYHLTSEPVLFLAGADGVVRQRIDGLYGHGEAQVGLTSLLAA